jgi:hypothetical protein
MVSEHNPIDHPLESIILHMVMLPSLRSQKGEVIVDSNTRD